MSHRDVDKAIWKLWQAKTPDIEPCLPLSSRKLWHEDFLAYICAGLLEDIAIDVADSVVAAVSELTAMAKTRTQTRPTDAAADGRQGHFPSPTRLVNHATDCDRHRRHVASFLRGMREGWKPCDAQCNAPPAAGGRKCASSNEKSQRWKKLIHRGKGSSQIRGGKT